MTPTVSWVVSAVATLIATALAMADSALLAFHASEASTSSDTSFAERERLHRALSMGRVLSYIVAGTALSQCLELAALPMLWRIGTIALAAIVVCTITEGMARAIGYANPTSAYTRLTPAASAPRSCSIDRHRA